MVKIEDVWKERKLYSEIALLHCVTSYPTLQAEANLNKITMLKEIFSLVIKT